MQIKGIIDENFQDYQLPSFYIAFPCCTFKCEKEAGVNCCSNSSLACSPNIEVTAEQLVSHYLNNFLTEAIVFGGLEPLDTFEDVVKLVSKFREQTEDTIVIYTGYNEDEVTDKIEKLKQYKNIIVKFGRFIPNDVSHFDKVLGITLASQNQYGKKIS